MTFLKTIYSCEKTKSEEVITLLLAQYEVIENKYILTYYNYNTSESGSIYFDIFEESEIAYHNIIADYIITRNLLESFNNISIKKGFDFILY